MVKTMVKGKLIPFIKEGSYKAPTPVSGRGIATRKTSQYNHIFDLPAFPHGLISQGINPLNNKSFLNM